MELQGIVEHVAAEEVSGTFKKRSIILGTEQDSQYPQSINIEFQQTQCDLLNGINPGDHVKVYINLKGRKWTDPQGIDKWFNTIQGWKITKETQNTSF